MCSVTMPVRLWDPSATARRVLFYCVLHLSVDTSSRGESFGVVAVDDCDQVVLGLCGIVGPHDG
jgi:hypothetical protein